MDTTITNGVINMSVDIRHYTRVIIRKNGQYLQGKEMSGRLSWNSSKYTAWFTRDADVARKVAVRTGGIAMLFNPVVGKVSVL